MSCCFCLTCFVLSSTTGRMKIWWTFSLNISHLDASSFPVFYAIVLGKWTETICEFDSIRLAQLIHVSSGKLPAVLSNRSNSSNQSSESSLPVINPSSLKLDCHRFTEDEVTAMLQNAKLDVDGYFDYVDFIKVIKFGTAEWLMKQQPRTLSSSQHDASPFDWSDNCDLII